MKAPCLAALLLAVCAPLFAADAPKADAPKGDTEHLAASTGKADSADAGRIPYSYGYELGKKLADLTFTDTETTQILAGLGDAMQGRKAPYDPDKYGEQIRAMIEGHLAAKLAKDKATGQAFGEKFAKEEGGKPLTGGGWYKILKQGTGASPAPEDTVKVGYEGKLLDGTVFDASARHGGSATFQLNGVIPCWTNGVAKMKVGGKAKLVCPSDVAYGDRGEPRAGIAGGATLIFTVELLEVTKAGAKTPAAGK